MQDQQTLIAILDSIENGRYKHAHALATKTLKRMPTNGLVQAMLAYSADRLDKKSEALLLVRQLLAQKPPLVDDLALQLTANVLRFNKMFDDIAILYANASLAAPHSQELATQHCLALVRCGALKQLQMAALKAQKSFKDWKFFFWAVAAIYLQGVNAPKGSPGIYFPLAEKMLEKARDENAFSSSEELYLYVLVLEAQSKYMQCIKLLSSDLATKLFKVESESKQLVLKFMALAQQSDSLMDLCLDGLNDLPDDWSIHLYLAKSVHEIVVEQAEELIKDVQEAEEFKRAHGHLLNLQSTAKSKVKGPFLSEIELFCTFDLYSQIDKLLVSYFKKFGSTISFFEDVRRYLDLLPQDADSRAALIAALGASDNLNEENKINEFRKRINLYKVRYCLTRKFSAQKHVEFFELLLKEYEVGLEMGTELKATERQYGDDALVIAALLIIDQFQQSKDVKLIYRAIFLLETGLQKSTYNFQMKIMLIRLYTYLGVSEPVVTHSISLDIKQVLLDTLTYLYADEFERMGPLHVASQVVRKAMPIYYSNERETPEMLIQAFKFGTYSKIPEFEKFQKRLDRSIQQSITNRQIVFMDILELSVPSKYKDLVEFVSRLDDKKLLISDEDIEQLYDNRDKKMDISWKSGEPSFFSCSSENAFPKPRGIWLKVYGAMPLVIKSWVAGTSIDESLLAILESVSNEEGYFGISILKQFGNQINDAGVLKQTIEKIHAQVEKLGESIQDSVSFASCNEIHQVFEAICYARIVGACLNHSKESVYEEFAKQLKTVVEAAELYLIDIQKNVARWSLADMKRKWLDEEEALPKLVSDSTVKSVFEAAQSSSKTFLVSLINALK